MPSRSDADDALILRQTIAGPELLRCPHSVLGCDFTVDVPAVEVNDQIAAVFGMSGDTLAKVHADTAATRAARDMRNHLASHTPEDWLRHLLRGRADRVDETNN